MKTSAKLVLSSLISCLALAGCGSDSDETIAPIVDQCSARGQVENFYAYMQENYLWNEDMPTNVNPGNYNNIYDLLEALVVPEDRYSFILTEDEYQSRFVDAEYAGFGFSSRLTLDDRVFINYVYANSPAEIAGMKRSDELTHINGESVQTLIQQGRYQDALGGAETGVSVELTWQDVDGVSFTDVLTKEIVETNTVLATERFLIDGKEVGYYVLNSFINRTGDDLNSAYDQLVGVDELVIDLRYNGGGLTRYANQASTQAAGDTVIGEVFTKYLFNANNSDSNFIEQFQLYDGIEQLNLNRVYVLTTGASCSSSELIINSLDPFVDVIVVGQPTCGKPVGQIPELLCDKRAFVVNFETVNAIDEGRYYDGLAPNCSAEDILVGDWGDENDPMLQAAAYHMTYGQCQPTATSLSNKGSVKALNERQLDAKQHPTKLPDLWRQEH
ncbi:Peptidase family S41 [Pseudidiomarina maritima]|uniref:Peptidase family S41 n=1 Tax=Pseudidiomarina maritima TaxID=519453 RepID=A0A1I6I231_9GAMM|nr:S41 family peptidase [Pseudidiomarina maritima]SFR60796.1 Peptidase family S41 [Pseudidiomarina maritima]